MCTIVRTYEIENAAITWHFVLFMEVEIWIQIRKYFLHVCSHGVYKNKSVSPAGLTYQLFGSWSMVYEIYVSFCNLASKICAHQKFVHVCFTTQTCVESVTDREDRPC